MVTNSLYVLFWQTKLIQGFFFVCKQILLLTSFHPFHVTSKKKCTKICIMRSEHLSSSKLQQWKPNNSVIERTYMYMYSCSSYSPVPYSCCCCVTHRCPVSWCVWGAKAVSYAHITWWSLSACGSGRVVLLFSHHLLLSLETESPSTEVCILMCTGYSRRRVIVICNSNM